MPTDAPRVISASVAAESSRDHALGALLRTAPILEHDRELVAADARGERSGRRRPVEQMGGLRRARGRRSRARGRCSRDGTRRGRSRAARTASPRRTKARPAGGRTPGGWGAPSEDRAGSPARPGRAPRRSGATRRTLRPRRRRRRARAGSQSCPGSTPRRAAPRRAATAAGRARAGASVRTMAPSVASQRGTRGEPGPPFRPTRQSATTPDSAASITPFARLGGRQQKNAETPTAPRPMSASAGRGRTPQSRTTHAAPPAHATQLDDGKSPGCPCSLGPRWPHKRQIGIELILLSPPNEG